MNIRELRQEDATRISEIHSQFYHDEFDLSYLLDPKSVGIFVVTDDNDQIICVGGIKPIIESVLITDKNFSVRQRRSALIQVLQASLFTCDRLGYGQLHCFIQDETWLKHLGKFGFKPTKGKALVISL